MCSAITAECSTCSNCQVEAVDYYQCIGLTAGCLSFECDVGSAQIPTNLPTSPPEVTICEAESDALGSCTADQSCTTCMLKVTVQSDKRTDHDR